MTIIIDDVMQHVGLPQYGLRFGLKCAPDRWGNVVEGTARGVDRHDISSFPGTEAGSEKEAAPILRLGRASSGSLLTAPSSPSGTLTLCGCGFLSRL